MTPLCGPCESSASPVPPAISGLQGEGGQEPGGAKVRDARAPWSNDAASRHYGIGVLFGGHVVIPYPQLKEYAPHRAQCRADVIPVADDGLNFDERPIEFWHGDERRPRLQDTGGPVLAFAPSQWHAFIEGVKQGVFDLGDVTGGGCASWRCGYGVCRGRRAVDGGNGRRLLKGWGDCATPRGYGSAE